MHFIFLPHQLAWPGIYNGLLNPCMRLNSRKTHATEQDCLRFLLIWALSCELTIQNRRFTAVNIASNSTPEAIKNKAETQKEFTHREHYYIQPTDGSPRDTWNFLGQFLSPPCLVLSLSPSGSSPAHNNSTSIECSAYIHQRLSITEYLLDHNHPADNAALIDPKYQRRWVYSRAYGYPQSYASYPPTTTRKRAYSSCNLLPALRLYQCFIFHSIIELIFIIVTGTHLKATLTS